MREQRRPLHAQVLVVDEREEDRRVRGETLIDGRIRCVAHSVPHRRRYRLPHRSLARRNHGFQLIEATGLQDRNLAEALRDDIAHAGGNAALG